MGFRLWVVHNTEYSELFKSSEYVWKEYLKKSEIIVGTDDEYVKTAINFALYHLRIMVKADDNRVGIGAKALSGEVYKGHSFWDTELFILLKKLDISKYKNAEAVLCIYNDYNTKQLNEYMVSKQSDTVMLLYLFRDLFDYETRKKNFVFYEDKTLHDSSLSKSTHAILANEFDFEDMSYKLFKGAISVDLGPNMKSSDDGIHSASIGGIWATFVFGFGGANIDGKGLSINPCLSVNWDFLEFPLVYQGTRLRVRVEKDNQVSVKKLQGKSVEIYIKGEKQLIK